MHTWVCQLLSGSTASPFLMAIEERLAQTCAAIARCAT